MRTGIPSLDMILHGGIPVGTLLVIEESPHNDSSNILVKALLGEGAVSRDHLFYYSERLDSNAIPDIRRIGNNTIRGDFSIRYETFAQNSEVSEPYAINLSSIKADYKNLVQKSIDCSQEDLYHKLWATIRNDVQETYTRENDLNLRRICIKSIFSSSWPQKSYSEIFEFLRSVKTLLRSRNGVCILTTPLGKIDENLRLLILKNSDMVILSSHGDHNYPIKLVVYKAPKSVNVEENSVYSLVQLQGTVLVQEI